MGIKGSEPYSSDVTDEEWDCVAVSAFVPGRCGSAEARSGHGIQRGPMRVDQGYTGPNAAEVAQQHGVRLEVVKPPITKRGFVLLPRRWVVERSFAWAARFRRLVRDYERLDSTLKGLHYIACAILMTNKLNTALIRT